MKRKNYNFKGLLAAVMLLCMLTTFAIGAYADDTADGGADVAENAVTDVNTDAEVATDTDIPQENESAVVNVFEEIYAAMEANADKIFSILAFVGTIVVGVGYKSGLLPLLRDALSRLKGSIDGVKADGEISKALTESKMNELGEELSEINIAIEKNAAELSRIQWQFESYEELCRQREAMRTILENQIDMLYAIFMSSALPQYQKDEIGIKIQRMREELASYENTEN